MAKQKPKDELTTEMYHEFLEDAGVDAGTKMETIFYHGVTEKEVIALCGLKKNRQQFLDWGLDQEDHYACIYRLYLMRGDKEKAMEYFNKLPNTLNKWFSLGNHCLS